MDDNTAAAYIESMLNAYRSGGVTADSSNDKYRLIWVSEMDVIALEKAKDALKGK